MTEYKFQLSHETQAAIQAIEKSMQDTMAVFEPMRTEIAKSIEQALQQIVAMTPVLPQGAVPYEDIKEFSEKLSHRGWFPSNEMSLPFAESIRLAFNEGNVQKVDDQMSAFVRSRIENLHGLFAERFPARSSVISSAINAHLGGQYILSIPVFLMQAEGICIEEFGVKLYSTSKGYPVIAKQLQQLGFDDFTGALLHPLMQPMGISQSGEFRVCYPDCLNRHEILHGIDSGYGTEINSLKSLSLLEYVATLLWEANAEIN